MLPMTKKKAVKKKAIRKAVRAVIRKKKGKRA